SARLVYLQVTQHDRLVNRARQQQQNAVETSAPRGDLIDRQERQLARTVQTVSLFIDPTGLEREDLECTVLFVSKALGLNSADLTREFTEAKTNNRHFVWIARRLDAELANSLVAMNLPGLGVQAE